MEAMESNNSLVSKLCSLICFNSLIHSSKGRFKNLSLLNFKIPVLVLEKFENVSLGDVIQFFFPNLKQFEIDIIVHPLERHPIFYKQ